MSKEFAEQVKNARKSTQRLTDPVDNYVLEPIAMVMSRVFCKLNVHPNFVTVLSLITGVSGGVLFAFDSFKLRLIGVLLVILSGIFDISDGQVARLSHKGSEFGRMFDGLCDFFVYFSIYAGICHFIMRQNIPFTDIQWGIWIWPVALVVTIFFHLRQAQYADYYRQVHMYLSPYRSKTELIRAKDVKKQSEEETSSPMKQSYTLYYGYTKLQERRTPYTQKLLDAIENNDKVIPDGLKKDYDKPSLIITRLSNFMTFTLRTIPLYVFVLIGQPILDFVYIVVVLGILCLSLKIAFEKLAKKMLNKYFTE